MDVLVGNENTYKIRNKWIRNLFCLHMPKHKERLILFSLRKQGKVHITSWVAKFAYGLISMNLVKKLPDL